MKDLGAATEDDMVAAFLRAELMSPRYRSAISELLLGDGAAEEMLTRPDTSDAGANAYRQSVLARYRGYGLDRAVFHGFPSDFAWHRASASLADLRTVRYINWEYWVSLSGDSRLAEDAAERLRCGEGDATEFRVIIEAMRGGAVPPELILAGQLDWTGLVVLEGHTRLTAYLLEPTLVGSGVDVLVGRSGSIGDWRLH